jgi:hypothetical protein
MSDAQRPSTLTRSEEARRRGVYVCVRARSLLFGFCILDADVAFFFFFQSQRQRCDAENTVVGLMFLLLSAMHLCCYTFSHLSTQPISSRIFLCLHFAKSILL